MDKVQIRKLVLSERKKLNLTDKSNYDDSICLNLLNFCTDANVKTIMAFNPFATEPNIRPTLERLLKSQIDLYLPITTPSKIEVGKVVNPLNFAELEKSEIQNFDLIVVPGLAFNTQTGDRLGYGKGYYDKFLSQATGLKIGLCYDSELGFEWMVEKHDQKVDCLITQYSFIKI